MEIIVPAAGLSTRFPNVKPKFLLYDYKGESMIKNAIKPFLSNDYNITIGLLKIHDDTFKAIEQIKHDCKKEINFVLLENPTRGPADTVYQLLSRSSIDGEFLVKDCDSFFNHEITTGNYICVSNINEHEVLKKIYSKSFVISNNQGLITSIIEKEIVSNMFCVGGYKFQSAKEYKDIYNNIDYSGKEIFISDIISFMLSHGSIFTTKQIFDYVDVGILEDWLEYNDKPVIFCDIDGTIIKAQSKLEILNHDKICPLHSNVNRLLELQKNGAQIIFTTARNKDCEQDTKKFIEELGFKNFVLLTGLQNSKRILINDYNEANPFPRAEAINIKRNSDNLSDFI
jgi:hypothetical protein